MTRILAAVMEVSSMRAMTDKFNTDISIENMEELCGEKRGTAILENNQWLSKEGGTGWPSEACVKDPLRINTVKKVLFLTYMQKYWQILIDGTKWVSNTKGPDPVTLRTHRDKNKKYQLCGVLLLCPGSETGCEWGYRDQYCGRILWQQ